MAIKNELITKEAEWGERMIEVKVRFWTDGIAKEPGKILPRHAWAGGVVRMERNKAHEIKPQNPVPFNSLMDLLYIIEKVLIKHSITLHSSDRMRKYLEQK